MFTSPSGVPLASLAAFEGLDVWIVDALRPKPHPSHYSYSEAQAAIAEVGAKRAILHPHARRARLPDHETGQPPADIEPAFDGMVIEFEVGS